MDCETPTLSQQFSGHVVDQCSPLEDDPALWTKQLSDNERCSIVQKGPVQIKDKIFPRNQEGRRFTNNYYYMHMRNGEKTSRSWLMYSERKDSVICFCCCVFGNKDKSTQLSEDGVSDWKKLSVTLRQHEKSAEHIANMENGAL